METESLGSPTQRPYALAVGLATAALLVALLILPTLYQHIRNHNLGATVLVAGALISNFMIFLNAVIWSHDDLPNWYNGVGICDIEVKLKIMLQSLFPAAAFCILRALARVLDTDSASLVQTTAQKRRGYIIDIVCSLVIPALQMIFHYIVQPLRYQIYGIAGCWITFDQSWLAFVILSIPPLAWAILDAYYAVLILVRLIKYRRSFHSLLANSNTSKSRFLRLYLLCCITVLGMLPLFIFVAVNNATDPAPGHFSWAATHHPTEYKWNSVTYFPSNGHVLYDVYVWIAAGILVFCFLGLGKDAMRTYRTCLVAIGLGRIFPSLDPDSFRGSRRTTLGSIGSKAKLMFKSKGSGSTGTDTIDSTATLSPSPKKTTFLESIKEKRQEDQRLRNMASPVQQEKPGRFASFFSKKPKKFSFSNDPFVLGALSTNVRSSISHEPLSPTAKEHAESLSRGDNDVLVHKEFRQASETAETLPPKMHENV